MESVKKFLESNKWLGSLFFGLFVVVTGGAGALEFLGQHVLATYVAGGALVPALLSAIFAYGSKLISTKVGTPVVENKVEEAPKADDLAPAEAVPSKPVVLEMTDEEAKELADEIMKEVESLKEAQDTFNKVADKVADEVSEVIKDEKESKPKPKRKPRKTTSSTTAQKRKTRRSPKKKPVSKTPSTKDVGLIESEVVEVSNSPDVAIVTDSVSAE